MTLDELRMLSKQRWDEYSRLRATADAASAKWNLVYGRMKALEQRAKFRAEILAEQTMHIIGGSEAKPKETGE